MNAAGKYLPRSGRQAVLEGLRLHGADDAQPDGGGNQRAQMLEEKKVGRTHPRQAEPAGSAAKYRREVPEGQRVVCQTESFFHHHQESAALRAAGAVGHMISEKGVGQAIQFRSLFRRVMRGGGEWQRRVS